MNAKHLLFPLLLSGLSTFSSTIQAKGIKPETASQQHLCFVENKGQIIDEHGNSRHDINYRLGGSGLSMFIGKGQLHYQWASPAAQAGSDKQQVALYRMDVTLLGADPQAQAIAEQKQDFYERYYTPQFGEQGATAYSYKKITYINVYPNIDWVLYVKNSIVEYDFVVRPGGKVSDIKLQYSGATQLSIDKDARLTAVTPMGSITENAPYSYQQADGKKISSFFTLKDNVVSFSTNDYTGTLVIDPTLNWSTYYGGSGDDQSRNNSLCGDTYGNAYLGGYTQSTLNIATTGSFKDTLTGAYDGFLVKFNSAGVRQWATYYGGANTETVTGIAYSNTDKVYLAGYTNSNSGIATVGSYQNILGTTGSGTDAFLVQFDSSGARQWATYFGGSSTENGLGVNCDRDGNVFLTGYTGSTANIATVGAYQTVRASSSDAFLAKFNNAGTLKWATYYGGTGVDRGLQVVCDSAKNVYMVGYTQSTASIASVGAFQTVLGGGTDAYLVKFDSAGTRLWATYYGGSATDQGLGVTCDQANNVYITGYTLSTSSISTVGSHQATFGGGTGVADAFLIKFDGAGIRQWGTYYGNTGDETGNGAYCDALGNIYMIGNTNSTSAIATIGTFQDTLNGTSDAYIVKFDTAGVRKWGTYFGGEGDEGGYAIYCNNLSKVFISGYTSSFTNLATVGSHQSTFAGGGLDAFLAKFNDCQLTAPTSISGNDTVCRNTTHTYAVTPIAGATSYTWTLPMGWLGSSSTNSISVTVGTTSDTIRVAANFACGTGIAAIKNVIISPLPAIAPSGTIQLCNGDSATLTASAGVTYQWLSGGLPIAGANANSYNAHTANTYAVIVTNAIGCADTSLTDTLIVHPIPVPVITASGALLSTGSYSTYQWSHDGTPITGATGATYTVVITSGDYTVTVTDSNGCTGTSAPYSPTVGVHEIPGIRSTVSIYPNPVEDWLYINAVTPVMITISSMDGKLLLENLSTKKVDMKNWAAGLYLLRIYDVKGTLLSTEKLVKAINNW